MLSNSIWSPRFAQAIVFAALLPFNPVWAAPQLLQPGIAKAAPACNPVGPDEPTIDIDFRTGSYDGEKWTWNNVTVTAQGGSLSQGSWQGDCDPADPNDPGYHFADGLGVGSGKLPGVEKGEYLVIDFTGPDGKAAFDVTGAWFSDFEKKGSGETCEIELTELGGKITSFTFSRKNDSNKEEGANPNNEFLVNFGLNGDRPAQPLRLTAARITGISGDCGVIGFSNSPISFDFDAGADTSYCADGGDDPDSCLTAQLAAGVSLDIQKFQARVKGTLYKEGVIVAEDPRGFCAGRLDGSVTEQPDPNELIPLYVDLDGAGPNDIVIPREYCGYPDPGLAGTEMEGKSVIYFLLLRSAVRLDADFFETVINDSADDGYPDEPFLCASTDPAYRPVGLRLPNNLSSENGAALAPFDEIPYLDANDPGLLLVDANADGVPIPREVTVGPCGSTRIRTDYSVLAYHLTHAVVPKDPGVDPSILETPYLEFYDDLFSQSLRQLQADVLRYFPCVDRYGTAQSTLQYYLNLILDNYTRDDFERVVAYINEFIDRLEDPSSHLYEDLLGCNYDLQLAPDPATGEGSPYVNADAEAPIPEGEAAANAIGRLRAKLYHLLWLAYTGPGLLSEGIPPSTCPVNPAAGDPRCPAGAP